MNELYITTEHLIKCFELNPLVHTLSFLKSSEIDPNKENIYPLVNIDLVDSDPINGQVLVFNYQVTILQQRDYTPKLNNDKLLLADNLIDNLNETYGIATRVINNLEHNTESDIELVRKSNVLILKDYGTQKLDGVRFTMSLEIPNITMC